MKSKQTLYVVVVRRSGKIADDSYDCPLAFTVRKDADEWCDPTVNRIAEFREVRKRRSKERR